LLIWLVFIAVGLLAGVLSGLFGLGGGIVIVPCLLTVFNYNHVNPDFIMHLSIGTSLAVMIGTTANSVFHHSKKNTGYFEIYRQLFGGLMFGVICGATLGHYLHGHVLKIIFGVLVVVIGLNMLRPDADDKPARSLPKWYIMQAMGVVIGCICALLGVGGGFITVPFLIRYGVSVHLAIMVSAMVALTIGVLGTAANIYLGWSFTTLPSGSIGYVVLPVCLVIIIGTLFSVPLGTKLAYRLPAKQLKKYFAVFLLFVGAHMLF